LSSKIEPGVCISSKRLEAIRKLSEAGIYTGILMMPILPLLEDSPENIRSIVLSAHQAGSKFIYPTFGVTLRNGQREYLYKKFDELFPDQHVRQDYINRYGSSYLCSAPEAKKLWQLFTAECDRFGILYKMNDIITNYKKNYEYQQITFPL
jgi:DNA repair photolyase